MAEQQSAAQMAIGDIAPKFADLTDEVLFGDVWERPGLSPRDRSLITVSTLVALYRTDQLGFHLAMALGNGVTQEVDASTTWAELSVEDYAERTAATKAAWQSMNGQQSGDPAKLARVLLAVAELPEPPLRFVAGADAIPTAQAKAEELLAQAEASRELGMALAHDDAA